MVKVVPGLFGEPIVFHLGLARMVAGEVRGGAYNRARER
jgi:hypothetical protein